MKLPRNLSGSDLVNALAKLGYTKIRQKGSHCRLRTEGNGGHSITVPMHDPVKIGTLYGILNDVAEHFELTKDEAAERLFGD